jgi:hypothetical protein
VVTKSMAMMVPAVAAARFDSSIIIKLHKHHQLISEGPEPQHSPCDQLSWRQGAGSRGTTSNYSSMLFQKR